MRSIIIATPHARNDSLEAKVRECLPEYEVIRIRNKNELLVERLAPIEPDFIFFPHWSWNIPADIFSKYECVIFHMTDLPYGRGGSPLQNLIVRKHAQTKITALKCIEIVDGGPIYLKKPLSLEGSAEDILKRASDIIADMVLEIVRQKPIPLPQLGETVQFSRRTPEDGNLEPLTELHQIYDHIRMLDADGYPSAFFETANFRLEFKHATLTDGAVKAEVWIKSK